jgi:DNA-directed RNA polymerase subunit H
MSGAPYSPAIIVATLREFLEGRDLEVEAATFDRDRIISDMAHGYVRIDARRKAGVAPRGARDLVVALVLSADGKYAQNGPALRTLLAGIGGEAPAALDELILVVEEEFLDKKNVMDVFRTFAEELKAVGFGEVRGADPEGRAPFCNVYPYHIFAMNIRRHLSVPPHRIMSAEEVGDLLATQRKQFRDLPSIYANDPPVIWCGGRESHVVEITRASEVAATAMYYRRVVARPI